MSADSNVWDKLTRLVIFLLFIAYLLGVAVWYLPNIRTNENLRRAILLKEAEIQKQEQTRKQLSASIDALQRDPKAKERLIRQRLGYGKPEETIIRFEGPATNTVSRRP
jgi:cell division protein FtsB